MQLHEYEYADYLSLEHHSEVKHEFVDGEIYAMTGGTPRHARLTMRVGRFLDAQLDGGPCRAYSSDLRVRAVASNVTTYPAMSGVCGEPELDPDDAHGHGVINPTVVVEVTSPSTERYDRGRKLAFYESIDSVRAVVLVSHREPSIEVHARKDDGTWTTTQAGPGQTAEIEAIGCQLVVDDVYAP
jgi:Uma2 family endonuclease